MSHQPQNNLTDRQLVGLVLGGDTQAFGHIVRATEGLVAQIVYKLIVQAEDRKDLVQDIYMKVFHHLKGFKFQSRLSTWIAQIAYNTCINRLQQRKLPLAWPPEGDWEDGGNSPKATEQADRPILQKELRGRLHTEIGRLPPIYQTLISLYHQEEMSYQEMAQITGLPEGTVKSYLFRARKQLKENLLSDYQKEQL